jgi:DNA-binding CsgD family transcriptional regulator
MDYLRCRAKTTLTISEERKKRVIDLYYNQGKTTREIAKIERMSIRDISAILKEEEARRQKYKQEELSSKAYKLFSEGKTPVQVAIILNLREPEVTKLYREYWKLKRLHRLYSAYTELGDEGIGDFLKLCKLAKKEGVSKEQVVKLLQLADEDNPFGLSRLEKRCNWLINKIHDFDMQIERSKNYLYNLNDDEIASAKALLNSYHLLCERKRQEAEDLNNEITRLEAFVSRFKSNNEEYLKIKHRVEEEVRSFLTDGKVLLQFVLASVIEALRRNPDKFNNLLVHNTSSSSTTTTPTQELLPLHNEDYKIMILDEADKLYNELIKELVNRIMSSVNPLMTSLS